MAKFCSNCGRKLKEGEVCDCKKDESSLDLQNGFNQVLEFFKGMFTKPVNTIKSHMKASNFTLSCIIIAVIGVITGLFGMLLIKEMINSATTLTYGLSVSPYIEIPYFKVFIITTIATIALYYLQALILYLVAGKMFKANIDYKESFNFLTALAVYSLAGIIISFIGVLISPAIFVIIMALVMMFTLITFALGVKEAFKLNDAKTMYAIILTNVFFSLIVYIIMLIFN